MYKKAGTLNTMIMWSASRADSGIVRSNGAAALATVGVKPIVVRNGSKNDAALALYYLHTRRSDDAISPSRSPGSVGVFV